MSPKFARKVNGTRAEHGSLDVAGATRAEIAASFAGGGFPHNAGHGVGLGSHDDPHVIPGDDTPLQEGSTIALEPGVCFTGRFGARVEQDCVVTRSGGRELREYLRADERRVS